MTAPSLHPLYAAMPTTVFERMSGLARQTGAINLGQGFPDGLPPAPLIEALTQAVDRVSHQYPPMAGLPVLREAVAGFYARRQGLAVLADDVVVTSGATEALAAAILAVVQPGDEVLVFAPAYDAYAPLVRRAGGVPVFVALAPPDWALPLETLRQAVTPRTRALILNDPLNPTGTVTTAADRAAVAQLCLEADLVAICDEVWETVRFDGAPHRPLMAEPGMAERTIKIGSAGNIFGATGWKVGWLLAAPAMAAVVARAHQFLTFTTPPMLQAAVAEGLAQDATIDVLVADWAASRQVLLDGLARHGFAVLPNAATWFACIDLARSGIALDDATFAERAVHEAGVATIPLSALWEGPPAPRHILRLCHCKPAAMLEEAIGRLAAWRNRLTSTPR